MPIIRSSRVLYRWLLPVVFGALVFMLSVWCGAEGYVSGLRAAVCRSGSYFPTCTLDGHLHRVTYTRCCIDTIDSPDDKHEVARNM
jgi:hypothetical protein